jgi:hypothetical protein
MQKCRKTLFLLMSLCLFLTACNQNDSDQKAIWLYEQNQMVGSEFEFYPQAIRTVGVITANDSVLFIEHAMVHPLDSLIKENNRALNDLLQMQILYVKYDMELQREAISQEITQLVGVDIWLGKIRMKHEGYKKMSPEKPLIRKVECRFDYNDPLTGKKVTKDKIYFIHATTGSVLSSQDKHPVNVASTAPVR